LGHRARPRRSGPRSARRKALRSGTPTQPAQLRVFVYGTLKRGQSNHERFCRGLKAAQEATVQGRLYDLPYGFPALVVPETNIRATGTTDYLADTDTQNRTQARPQESSPGWNTVYGELLVFDDPAERLPVLDDLEGFRPGEESFYKRVLVPTTLAETEMTTLAWTYVVESASGLYLPGGRWPAQ
jgi:gamma-glutamylcyclotransferase (GGCT)/AIG2-like uncharacterized protein YtfP